MRTLRYHHTILNGERNDTQPFFGSHNGAQNAAVPHSLACSCKMHKENLFLYLTDVLNKVAAMTPNSALSKYRDILPERWAKNSRAECFAFCSSMRHRGDAYNIMMITKSYGNRRQKKKTPK